jgi:hypothetical protein
VHHSLLFAKHNLDSLIKQKGCCYTYLGALGQQSVSVVIEKSWSVRGICFLAKVVASAGAKISDNLVCTVVLLIWCLRLLLKVLCLEIGKK